jgi:hypothetical protein
MASFSININAEVNIPYTTSGTSFRRDDCSVITESIPVGLVNGKTVPSILFFLNNYTNANGWSTLRIRNIRYSSGATLYLSYNGVKLEENVDPNAVEVSINVSSVLLNTAIPLLTIELNGHTVTGNETIFADIEIEDTTTALLGRIDTGFYLIKENCLIPAPAPITTNSNTVNSCSTTRVVTVNVPRESSRYVLGLSIDGFGSITGGTLPETITASKSYTLNINGSTAGSISTYSRVELSVRQSATSGTTLGSSYISRNHSGNIC